MELVLLEIFRKKIRISLTATHCHGLAANLWMYNIRRGIRFKRWNMLRNAKHIKNDTISCFIRCLIIITEGEKWQLYKKRIKIKFSGTMLFGNV